MRYKTTHLGLFEMSTLNNSSNEPPYYRVLQVLKDWLVVYFSDFLNDDEFKLEIADFTLPRPGLRGKVSKIPEEENALRFLSNFFTFTVNKPNDTQPPHHPNSLWHSPPLFFSIYRHRSQE